MKLLILGRDFLHFEVGAHTKAVMDLTSLYSGESDTSEFSLK